MNNDKTDHLGHPEKRTGPDEKHPNWEPDETDEVYTAMRRGCFVGGWEQFARFLYAANKKLRQ